MISFHEAVTFPDGTLDYLIDAVSQPFGMLQKPTDGGSHRFLSEKF